MAEPDDLPDDDLSEDDHEDSTEGAGDIDAGEQPSEASRTDLASFLAGIDVSALLPKIDLSAFRANVDIGPLINTTMFTAGIDFSAFTPKIDLGNFAADVNIAPVLDAAAFTAGLGTAALMPKVDFGAFTTGIDFSALFAGLDLGRMFAGFDAAHLRGFYPPNWPPGVDLDRVAEVIRDDGIPLVWVPRREVVEAVLAAPDRQARIAVLLRHCEDLVLDCTAVLDSVTEPTLAGQLPLARSALTAYANGHRAAAQALATVVTESAVAAALSRDYKQVREAVSFDLEKTSWTRLRLMAALAPIDRFYTAWYRSWGTPAPEALSRHVTVHEANTSHYTDANALLAVLLVTSVLRGLQELQEYVQPDLMDDDDQHEVA